MPLKLNGRSLVSWCTEKGSEYIHYLPLTGDNQNNVTRTILAPGMCIV